MKGDAFWDQAGKYSVSYVKVAEKEAWAPVCALLDDLLEVASHRDDRAVFLGGRGFVGICEYRLKFAKAVSVSGTLRNLV